MMIYPLVMAGPVPAIHVFLASRKARKTWMPGTRPGMTSQNLMPLALENRSYSSIMTLKPPQNMRLPSNGIAFGSIMLASRGSFITLAMTRSRWARDL